jgi:hypothetical protein
MPFNSLGQCESGTFPDRDRRLFPRLCGRRHDCRDDLQLGRSHGYLGRVMARICGTSVSRACLLFAWAFTARRPSIRLIRLHFLDLLKGMGRGNGSWLVSIWATEISEIISATQQLQVAMAARNHCGQPRMEQSRWIPRFWCARE